MDKIKKIGLIIYYIFIWLLFILNLVVIYAGAIAILNGNMGQWFIFIIVAILPFFSGYILRHHFRMLAKLIVNFLSFMKNIKLTLPVTILLGCIILGGFFYASQVNKQKSIERQQQIELRSKVEADQVKVEQDKKEYIVKRKKDCYDLETSERKKFSNTKSSEYDDETDVCIITYTVTDNYWKGKNCDDLLPKAGASDFLRKMSLKNYFNCKDNTFSKEF